MASLVFVECGCPPEPVHRIAQNIGYVFYCADCRGFISLRNDTIEGLIETLTRLLEAQKVDLGPLRP